MRVQAGAKISQTKINAETQKKKKNYVAKTNANMQQNAKQKHNTIPKKTKRNNLTKNLQRKRTKALNTSIVPYIIFTKKNACSLFPQLFHDGGHPLVLENLRYEFLELCPPLDLNLIFSIDTRVRQPEATEA